MLATMSRVYRLTHRQSGGSEPWLKGKTGSERFTTSPVISVDAKEYIEPTKGEPRQSVRLVYVRSPTGTVNQDLMIKLEAGLKHHNFSLVGKFQELDGKHVFDGSLEIETGKATLLLAVIGVGHTKKVAVTLQKYADRKLGTHMVCLTEVSIANRIDEATRHGGVAHIPATIRAKINHKLGKQTFARAELQDLLRGRSIMVAAAHIAHLGEKEKYYPSIASVVGSHNDSSLQFSGSVRLQRTTKALNDATPQQDIRQYSANKIEHLESMMQGLFEQWKKVNEGKLPTELIFFRDGIDFDDIAIQAELEELQSAYALVSPAQKRPSLNITYIVVNKNTRLQYKYSNTPAAGKTTPVSDYFAEGDNIGKFRYYVIRDDAGRTNLPTLTRCLNESSPLTSQYEQTAKALPLLYASKLSKRVHSYFRYHPKAVTEIEPVKRKVGDVRRRIKAEDEAVVKVNELLKLENKSKESNESNMGPWKASLDGTMFYL
jgi:plasmid maintenance system killer protein